jgi:hypothetical protein
MKKAVHFVFLLLITSMFSACLRQGCTDEVGFNFDPKAGKDNGSCLYSSTLLVWFTPQTANQFYNQFGTNFFNLIVDDMSFMDMSTFNATDAAPDCKISGKAREVFMGDRKTKEITMKFASPNYSGPAAIVKTVTLTIQAGECHVYELTF